MSVTVQELYDVCTTVLLEDLGFVLGVFSEQQFLDVLAVVLLDFAQRAALGKTIFTEMISAGVAVYTVPDTLMKPELAFIGGKLIEKVTEADLTTGHFEWRKQWGPPRQWHEDNLNPKKIELFPKPDFNGANIPGDVPPIGTFGDFFPIQHNLSLVGPASPSKTAWTLADTLDPSIVPDQFLSAIVYGILEQVFSTEAELKDDQRALYCRTRYGEYVALAESLCREDLLDDED